LYRVHGRRNDRRVAEPGAEIAVAGHAQREKFSSRIQRQFGAHLVVAAVAVGEKAFRTFIGPFDRAAQYARGVQATDILRVGAGFHAERAADIAGEDAQLLHRDAEDAAQQVTLAEHALAAEAQDEAIGVGLVLADRGARLHRTDNNAVVAQ